MRTDVDVGGTKIEGLALAGDGTEIARFREATSRGDHRAPVERIAGVVRMLEDEIVVKAKHGDSSGVHGAAWLWPLEDQASSDR